MPRAARFPSSTLVEHALPVFWRRGAEATSIDDLIRATRASRHAIYHVFADKRGLLIACLDTYTRTVVDPAFAPVEVAGAGLTEIAFYFECQIAAAEREGFPGPGCFMANLMTEAAPHDEEIAAAVRAHLARLKAGFASALKGATGNAPVSSAELDGWAILLATTAQGVWAVSRVARHAADLRCAVAGLLQLIEGALAG